MVNETHDGGFKGQEMQREQREASSEQTILIPYRESSSIIISFSPEWGRSNLALQNVSGTQGANRLGLPPSVMLNNRKGINPMAQQISPGTELHSGVAANEEMGQRDYRLRALRNAGITVSQTEDGTSIHISRIPPNQWVQVNGQKYYGPTGRSLSTETNVPIRGMPVRYETGRQAKEQVPDGEIEVASVLGEDPVALAGRVNVEERRRSESAHEAELRHIHILAEHEQVKFDKLKAESRLSNPSTIHHYVHSRNEELHRDVGLHMSVQFGVVKLSPWKGPRQPRRPRGVPVMPMPQEMAGEQVVTEEVVMMPQFESGYTLERLEPQLVQEIQLLPVEFQRPVVLLAERMEVRERSVLIVLLEKLIHIGIGTFLSLPLFTPDGRLKKPGEGDVPAAVGQLLESLSPEERDVLERVAAICLDLKGVGMLASRPGRTESYPLDEESPALRVKILGMAKRFTEAEMEEDKLIAEGSLRMAGVDIDGSDLKGGKLTMLPTTGGARFVNLIVGLIQMGAGIFRKLGGKKTSIEKEMASLHVPDKDPKAMTKKGREKELTDDRKALSEGKTKEAKLETDIKELEAKLKDEKTEDGGNALKRRIEEAKAERAKLAEEIKAMEQRIKALEEIP